MFGFQLHRGLFRDAAGAPAGGAGDAGAAGRADNAGTPGNAGTAGQTGNAGAAGTTGNAGDAGKTGNAPAAFDWKAAGVPDADLALITERGWKSPADTVNSYRNLEKLTGVPADQIIKLPKTGDDAAWGQVYDRMGRPKAATDYKIPLPEGDTGDFAKTVAPMFYEAGMSQAQVERLATKWNAHQADVAKQATERANAEIAKQVSELKTEWGANYETNEVLVNRAAKAFGMTAEQLTALKQVLGPKGAMKFMHNIGSKVAVEDANLISGDVAPGFGGMSAETAQAEIGRLKQDRAFAEQFNSRDPKVRADARDRMSKLTKLAYPQS